MARKGTYTDKEMDTLDRFKHENKKLKRELKTVRKIRDRYAVAEEKGLIEENEIIPSAKRTKEKDIKAAWSCYKCNEGTLRLVIIGNRYFRKCDGCGKNTKSQQIHDNIKGVFPDGSVR